MDNLLPNNIDEQIKKAIQFFWATRRDEGVRSGKTMDKFAEIIRSISIHNGFSSNDIYTSGTNNLTIPGFYRATKKWDVLIISKGQLIAVFELKSHVGSFGNNFNNRTEEAVGSSADLWKAFRDFAYIVKPENRDKIRRPFLGYLMLVEDSDKSNSIINSKELHFDIFEGFVNTSYVDRYSILCRKLVNESQYSAASLILSQKEAGLIDGSYKIKTKSLSPKFFFSEFARFLLATKELM